MNAELSSLDIDVKVQKNPRCKVELEVRATETLLKEAKKAAIKEVGKTVSIPGFRKGKAPEALVIKKYPNDIEASAEKSLADIAFISAQKKTQIPLLNNNSKVVFKIKEKKQDEALVWFSFETEPEVPSVDPSLFEMKPVETHPIEEKHIDEAIQQARFFFATWTPVTERGVQEGDFIVIDLFAITDDREDKVFNQVRFEVTPSRMARWMQKLVLGQKTGSILEGVSEPDETASEEEKKEFIPKKIKLHLLEVEEAKLPSIDDELAKNLGTENVDKMRQSIESLLKGQAEEGRAQKLKEQVAEFLATSYPFELPQSIVEDEANHRFSQAMKDPQRSKEWEEMNDEKRKKIKDRITQESEESIRIFYLCRKIIQDAKLPISHQEVQREITWILGHHGKEKIDLSQVPKPVVAMAISRVTLKKAQEHILSHAKPLT